MIVPLVMFWVLLFVGREELGFKGIFISIAVWLILLAGSVIITGGHLYYFTAACALLDIVLLIVIFGGDINITLR